MIDGADLSVVVANLGCPVGAVGGACDRSDVNCDGVVDLRDIRVVQCQQGQAAPGDPACCDICACSGDVNGDMVIDGADLAVVTSRLGCAVGAGDPVCDASDVNCDGFVDMRDVSVIQCQFGQMAPGDVTCCDVCACRGDLDGDGDADGADLSIVVSRVGCAIGAGDPLCDASDVNCDGVVDHEDVAIVHCQAGPGQGDPGLCDPAPGACCFGCAMPGGPPFVCADLSRLDCVLAHGKFMGVGTACAAGPCANVCRADLNGDNVVDVFDFGVLSSNFGSLVTSGWCAGDLDCSGSVDVFDFSLFASQFGCFGPPIPPQCCAP
jgi:hypothetical protein